MAEALQIASSAVSLVDAASKVAVLVHKILRSSSKDAELLERKIQAFTVLVSTIQEDLSQKAEGEISERELADWRQIKVLIEDCQKSLASLESDLRGVQKDGRPTKAHSIPANYRFVRKSKMIERHVANINHNIQSLIGWYQILTRHEQEQQNSEPQVVNVNHHNNQTVVNIILVAGTAPFGQQGYESRHSIDDRFRRPRTQSARSVAPQLLEAGPSITVPELDQITEALSQNFDLNALLNTRSNEEAIEEVDSETEEASPQWTHFQSTNWSRNPGTRLEQELPDSEDESVGPSDKSMDITIDKNKSPFWEAIRNNDAAAVKQHLENGHNIFIKNANRGQTILHYGANHHADEALGAIFDAFTPVPTILLNAQDSKGKTPLMEAASLSHLESALNIATRLVESANCDINFLDLENRSALSLATNGTPRSVHCCRQRFFNLLLDKGADIMLVEKTEWLDRYVHNRAPRSPRPKVERQATVPDSSRGDRTHSFNSQKRESGGSFSIFRRSGSSKRDSSDSTSLPFFKRRSSER